MEILQNFVAFSEYKNFKCLNAWNEIYGFSYRLIGLDKPDSETAEFIDIKL